MSSIKSWLNERKAIAGKAARGEWRADWGNVQVERASDRMPICDGVSNWDLSSRQDHIPNFRDTLDHIADAHNSQPRLIAALERSVKTLERACICYEMANISCAYCDALADTSRILEKGEDEHTA